MKKFLSTVLAISFLLVIVGCDETDTKNDGEQTNDIDVVDNETEDLVDTEDELNTDEEADEMADEMTDEAEDLVDIEDELDTDEEADEETDETTDDDVAEEEPLEIIGRYVDGYGGAHIISNTVWDQGSMMGLFNVSTYNNEDNFMIAQNNENNTYNPSKYSRFDWMVLQEDLYYCQTIYNADTYQIALDTPAADSTDLASGCAGYSWSTLTPVVEENIDKDSGDISSWASGNASFSQGADVTGYDDPSKAYGPAEGTSEDIVCLGKGGNIVLEFTNAITNGEGADFAVFENGLNDTFLELGYVEVSSDGTNFVRFDTYYLGTEPVGSFGSHDPSLIWGFAGKFMQGKGTQFDLADLVTKAEVVDGTVDIDVITHVKIVDVIGDGSELDTLGNPIYDPYPTTGTAGFDLDAVAVINEVTDE